MYMEMNEKFSSSKSCILLYVIIEKKMLLLKNDRIIPDFIHLQIVSIEGTY